ncbi:hypothetical protein N0O92_15555 [Alkalihalobacillus sp. MEB130]|uniref:hypothetical protein n=1 Tax=Alkalihalobacillus sp. MEB130 TaxID=2976704 RepID=UPI0028E04B62|nr:hypothetical protein [Alkalihalobacillus sp. MEB130]MDT8861634.1 hypothetical protein [Alkalihalobacillus sp. MEB130]
MEQFNEFTETQHTWLLLIGIVIVVLFLLSLLKTLFTFAIILLVISIGASLLFDLSPKELVETGTTSVKKGSEFVQETMIPLLSEGYLGELFHEPPSFDELLEQFNSDGEGVRETIAEMLEDDK